MLMFVSLSHTLTGTVSCRALKSDQGHSYFFLPHVVICNITFRYSFGTFSMTITLFPITSLMLKPGINHESHVNKPYKQQKQKIYATIYSICSIYLMQLYICSILCNHIQYMLYLLHPYICYILCTLHFMLKYII